MNQAVKTVYLSDYQPSNFWITDIDIVVELQDQNCAIVKATMQVRRNGVHKHALLLDGEDLTLVEVSLNKVTLSQADYELTTQQFQLQTELEQFELSITTQIDPAANQALSGLYVSNDIFCTQCEAEGFRRITYFIDRPDNMATYKCKIIANKKQYPILLSNGNKVDAGDLAEDRHYALWTDPYPKPSYLFALVAGDLAVVTDNFTTQSGRDVKLSIYVEHGNQQRCAQAMSALKKAMLWDEKYYGREYDLAVFNIVAVADFNMGAMENKSLNIFNAKYILADPETATDDDLKAIEAVVAHEYFHNWTGNRITCRDWFQLSLKEGLTVFREQQFSADMNNADEMRINDVRLLRSYQFPEDSGPMAHAVQPQSYIEINNFYTMTVYHKGAELNHMLHLLLGPERFRLGCDDYFSQYDGQAITVQEWVGALATTNQLDLSQFMYWYQYAGTPCVTVRDHYDAKSASYQLHVTQQCPDTPGQSDKPAFFIPLKIALLSESGKALTASTNGESMVLQLKQRSQVFEFENIHTRPIVSLLRGFSAPVKINYSYSDADLLTLFTHDRDGFAKWEAGQLLYKRELLPAIQDYSGPVKFTDIDSKVNALAAILANTDLDNSLKTLLFTLPSFNELAEAVPCIDPTAIVDVSDALIIELTRALEAEFLRSYFALHDMQYAQDHQARAKRGLKNLLLHYLVKAKLPAGIELCHQQYYQAANMTDKLAALNSINQHRSQERNIMLEDFYQCWENNPLVLDKWLAVQARSGDPSVLSQIQALLQHPAFNLKNPNKVRALLGVFASANPKYFHAKDGKAYQFLTEQIVLIDKFNPQVAARLTNNYSQWQKYTDVNREMMQTQLEKLKQTPELSRDVFEIVSKSLQRAKASNA
jgi:aminopeptidase N